MSLIALLRKKRCPVKLDQKLNKKWSDEELLSHVISVVCRQSQLTTLPDLPNCEYLDCSYNQLTTLPDLPKCEYLNCSYNRLTVLPHLPKCRNLLCYQNLLITISSLNQCIKLVCYQNRLTSLPNLPNCQQLSCQTNDLTSLPYLPNCQELNCFNNYLSDLPNLPSCRKVYCHNNRLTNLPNLSHLANSREMMFYKNELPALNFTQWRIIWKTKETYLRSKYFRLWYLRMLQIKGEKKKELHLELLWSPETKFYQKTDEYRHFLESSQPRK